ncbi:hypothetical protein [Aquicella lusitana]|uniref:Uncharacterized protein n=1 Tax=Aquicella lusitana TaxID=254246 RepID=A0A370GFA9_9COXI|nr:hypothetical protein [Aquicella lusitana]RDI41799.1 hypothetical protein C8D86_11715 [Aquicella lusitana]
MMICSLLIKLLISRWREPLCTFQLLAALSSRLLPHIAHPTLAEFTLALAELSSVLALIVIPLLLRGDKTQVRGNKVQVQVTKSRHKMTKSKSRVTHQKLNTRATD